MSISADRIENIPGSDVNSGAFGDVCPAKLAPYGEGAPVFVAVKKLRVAGDGLKKLRVGAVRNYPWVFPRLNDVVGSRSRNEGLGGPGSP